MADIVICGETFHDVDFTEYNTIKAVEEWVKKVQQTCDASSSIESVSDLTLKFCNVIHDMLDHVLGEGAGDAIYAGRLSMTVASRAFSELCLAYKDAQEEWKAGVLKATEVMERNTDKPVNREQRRDAEFRRGNGKKGKKNKKRYSQPGVRALNTVSLPDDMDE